MSHSNAATVPFEDSTESSSQPDEQQKKQPKPTRVLPTNRVSTPKQWDILRAFGAVSGSESKSTTNAAVSRVVGLHANTVGLITPFFTDIGLLKRADDGLAPAPEVSDFARVHEWAPETAFHRLGPILSKTWFFSALSPKLSFSPLSRDAALQELAIVSSAAPSYRGQLEALLEYLREANLVAIEGDQIRLQRSTAPRKTESQPPAAEHDRNASNGAGDPPPRASHIETAFSATTAGVVQFDISVKVATSEFANWQPSRISAFFGGIAQVLAAKGAVEENSAKK